MNNNGRIENNASDGKHDSYAFPSYHPIIPQPTATTFARAICPSGLRIPKKRSLSDGWVAKPRKPMSYTGSSLRPALPM